MILKFATKRNQNGNRVFLAIDTDSREYARQPRAWITKEDITEISNRDLHKILQSCIDSNWNEVSYLD